MGAAFPFVIAALTSTATTALNPVRVVRGRDVSHETGSVVMIGVEQLEETGEESPGVFSQEMQTFGGARSETGTINGLIVAWNGGSDGTAQEAATSSAFEYLASIEAALRADETLGLTQFDYVVVQMDSLGNLTESQDEDGASTALPFVVAYEARI